MKVTQDFIDGLSIPRDNVLFKLERGNDEVVINRGTEHEAKLYLPIDIGNINEHAPVVGFVAKAPLELTAAHSDGDWLTEIEVSKGDRVIVYYMEVVHALGMYQQSNGLFDKTAYNVFYTEEGDTYVLIPYSSIYCVINEDGTLRPVNGWVIGERIPLPEEKTESGIILNQDVRGNKWEMFYKRHIKVLYTSEKLNEYLLEINGQGVYTDHCIQKLQSNPLAMEAHGDLKQGDIVYLDNKHRAAPLEYDLHAVAGKNLVYFQRRHIMFTVDKVNMLRDW